MKVKIKKLGPSAVIPTYSKDGDAGMDLTAVSKNWDSDNGVWVYGTCLSFEIPKGYVGLLFQRSSVFKQQLILSNAVGVLDSGYRGEVLFKFRETHDYEFENAYEVGDRVGQIMILPYPQIEFEEVFELSDSERGTGGYGSTGN